MNKLFLLEQIQQYTDVNFTSFEQHDDTLIAHSYFFDIHLGTEDIKIVDTYTYPGPRLKKYVSEYLPVTLRYDLFEFYTVLLDTVDDVYEKCYVCEIRDNDEEEFSID